MLTAARVRELIAMAPAVQKATKKDRNVKLRPERLPDTAKGETLQDVVAPQMATYFDDSAETAAAFMRDYSRMLQIFNALALGGAAAAVAHYRRMGESDLMLTAYSKIGARSGVDVGRMATASLERQIAFFEGVTPEEEDAVREAREDILHLIGRPQKQRARKQA